MEPDRLQKILEERLPHADLVIEDLERLKKKEMGEIIGLFQSPEDLGYVFNSMYFRQMDLLSYLDILASVSIHDVEQARDGHLGEQARSVSLILPLEHPQ